MKYLIFMILFLCLFTGFSEAQNPDQGYYNYLKEQVTTAGEEIPEFIIEECWNFIGSFPESSYLPGVLYLLAQLYEAEKDYPEAFSTYMKHVILFPQNLQKNDVITAINQIVHNHADRVFRTKRTKIDEFLTSPQNTLPVVTAIYKYLNFVYELEIDELNEIIHREIAWYLRTFPKTAKNMDELILWQGDLFEKSRDWNEAASAYSKILFLTPDSPLIPQTLLQIGLIQYREQRAYTQARDSFMKIITDFPETQTAGDAQFYLAEVYEEKLDNPNEAAANYRLLIETYPKNANAVEALKRVAELHEDQDAYEEAISTYYQIFELYPNHQYTPEALLEIEKLYRRRFENYEKAIETLKLYSSQYSQREDAAERLFDAAEMFEDDLQNKLAAIETYREVISSFPESKYAKRAQERIEELSVE
jgi:TolA-binding protein